MRIALVLRGHYRSFEKHHSMWKDALDGCEYDCFFHTWDTRDTINQAWSRRYIIDPPKLESSHIDILKKWDPNLVIESQEFTSEDHKQIYASWTPHKALVYRINSLLTTLKRINKENYDMIIIGRYDLTVSSNLRFKDITVTPGELEMGARVCAGTILGGVAGTSELIAFHSSDVDKFYNPLDNADPAKYTNCEEWFTEIYLKIFKKMNHRWHWGKDFDISRE